MRSQILSVAAAGLLIAALTAACGSGSEAGGGGSGNADDLASAQAALKEGYGGTDGDVPSKGPAAAKGKDLWIVSCGQAAEGCSTPGAAAADAVKAIGWTSTTCDGKLNPTTYGECVRSATAAKPDGILLISVSCDVVQEPLKAAKAAGIKIYGIDSFDCDEGGGKPLFDGDITYHGYTSIKDRYLNGIGPAMANYLIAKHDGAPKTLLLREDDQQAPKYIADGIEKVLDDCAACKTYTLKISLQDFADGSFSSKVSAALVQHPDVNAVAAPYDATVSLGVGQAVLKAGRPITLTSMEGLASSIALIRKGTQTMDAGSPAGWVGWAAIDGLNRIFAGQPDVDSGIGLQTIDKDHNLPPEGEAYDGNVGPDGKPLQDYKAIYTQSWGR